MSRIVNNKIRTRWHFLSFDFKEKHIDNYMQWKYAMLYYVNLSSLMI